MMKTDHGTLHFELVNNILMIEGCGPWNKEAMILSLSNANVVQRLRTHEKWGVIVTLNGDPIHTPEAAELLVEYVKYDKQNGRIATALILTDCTAPALGQRHLSDLYNQAGEAYQFFNNINDAKMWMTSILAQAEQYVY
ncbi:hypothetical protein [Psychromonas sp. MME1]|uniref:hypothetical protein n=1 Tax=Psychromonas sp. MME1 TaxID=3231032 RepID=UPI0034E1F0C7